MTNKFFAPMVLPIVLLAVGAVSVAPQTRPWQKIAPLGQSFTVLVPTPPVEAFRRIPTSAQDSIPVGIYYSVAGNKRFGFAGFFKTPSVSGLSSYENFIAAMEYSLNSGAGQKALGFQRDLSSNGNLARQYRLRLGGNPGVARFLGTKDAFYVLLVVGAEEGDDDVSRFFSSFQLGEVNTNAEASGVSPRVVTMVGSSSKPEQPAVLPSPEAAIEASPPEPWPQPFGSITGGVLNGKAIHLEVPQYPAAARALHESGQVSVQVLIDEMGHVIRAEAVNGPPGLRESAVSAAWQSSFSPTRLMGQPVRVNGVIIYNFVAAR